MRRALNVVLVVLGVTVLCAPIALAQQIELSLNLEYSVPTNSNSGGTWTIVARTTAPDGIAAIDVKLLGIDSAHPVGPTGQVNGGDAAGFSSFVSFDIGGGITEILAYQFPLDDVNGGHQNIFYGVGSLENGSPDYPARPMGTNFIGPELPSLINVTGVPWGVPGSDFLNESNWDIAVPLIRGVFEPGDTPTFAGTQRGSVFLGTGSLTNAGQISCGPGGPTECNDPVSVTTIVRTNLMAGGSGDYNGDGVVNAADYVVWRNTLGDTVTPGEGADGDADGMITEDDYTFWVERFGTVIGAGTGAQTVAVPEPGAGLLTLLGVVAGLFLPRIPGFLRPS